MNCTIVMAIFNTPTDFLDAALRSVLGYGPLILGDDGSTHPVIIGADILSRGDVRFRRFDHKGMEPTLNALIELVRTDYVSVLDSDDVRFPGTIAQQCAYLDANADVVAVHGRFDYINEAGDVIQGNVKPRSPCHSSLVFRRSAWQQVGGYPTGFTFGEGDSHFIERLTSVGTVVGLPILCAQRRVRPESLSFPNQPRLQRIYHEHLQEQKP